MTSIVGEKLVSFKELEEKIFTYVCQMGCELIRLILEKYDDELAQQRDKTCFRNKGLRTTCIKTLCGEVVYQRRVYETRDEKGSKAFVYLLDQAMHMEKIGLISTNLAEKIVMLVTEAPYRVTAQTVSSICGQSISAQGVWELVQKLGDRISEEETQAVKEMKAGCPKGHKAVPILFEEMDGVWLRMQGAHHEKAPKQEMKVSTIYEGWDAESKGQSRLVGKRILAGMEKSQEFHEKREAQIERIYQADEIGQRILNGDGGSWIKEPYDPETVFQLDRFHVYKAIHEKLAEAEAQKAVQELLESGELEELFEYIQMYVDSVSGDEEGEKRSKRAKELYEYLWKNRKGLLPYEKQLGRVPEAGEGIVYRQMGVQESQNCTVVTLRMKNRRMRWSKAGANNLAKALYRKENGELRETIKNWTDGKIKEEELPEIKEVLSAAKAPKKEGKGNPYVDKMRQHMPMLDALRTESRKAFIEAFCR